MVSSGNLLAFALIKEGPTNIPHAGVNGNSSNTPGGTGGSIAIYTQELQNCNETSVHLVTTGGLGQRGQDGGAFPQDFDLHT